MEWCGSSWRRWGGLGGGLRVAVSSLFAQRMGRGTMRSMVEGYQPHPFSRNEGDKFQHAAELGPHALSRKPDYPDILLSQPDGSSAVMRDAVRMFMTLSIDLDGQLRRRAVEIEDIGPYRVLPAKLQTRQPLAAQAEPKPRLRRCHAPTQLAGSLDCQERCHPSTMLRMVPLPMASPQGGDGSRASFGCLTRSTEAS